MDIDPYENDPARWGASLATHFDTVTALLDAAQPGSILEVGAYAGDITRLLLDWARPSGARVIAVDPFPQPKLEQLDAERDDLELVRAPSLEALESISRPDVAIVDGDHNYYTVREELRLIAQASGERLPLILAHDLTWPHGRRDSYFDPDAIPPAERQPMVEAAPLFPEVEGTRPGGLVYTWAAAREGGPGNGVRTAVEDFAQSIPNARLAVIPAFFGLGVIWQEDAPWAHAVARIVEPLDDDPLLARLEANRVLHLASSHLHLNEAAKLRERLQKQEKLLNDLLQSKSFSVAERISRVRQRGKPAISKSDVRRALAD